jgi:hypothetical protein
MPPGDDATVEALGYLHANCGGCHNERNDWNPLRLWLTVGDLDDPASTPTYTTTIDRATESDPVAGLDTTTIVVPGDPDASMLYLRAAHRGEGAMPPIGTEDADEDALGVLRVWIESLSR